MRNFPFNMELQLCSVPRIKKGKSNVSILKPKISISFNGQANDIVGDYFLGADEPSWETFILAEKSQA